MSQNSLALLEKIPHAKVLATGDLILDRYIHGEALRLSPEAPVPVVVVRKKLHTPGGMGNVVMNLSALGAKPLACGLVGADFKAEILKELLADVLDPQSPGLLVDSSRPTTVKTRVIAGIQQVTRLDEESISPISPLLEERYKELIAPSIALAGAISISDYGKGFLTPGILAFLIDKAKSYDIPTIVDPKGTDYGRYRGASLVTPNRQELSVALGRDLTRAQAQVLAEGGLELMRRYEIENILITRSEDGMTLVESDGKITHLPTRARAVFDVSGAGDTVVATMAAAIAIGSGLYEAAFLATLAAGVVVGKVGTASAKPEEIIEFLRISSLKQDLVS
ncbi:MAG: PfkB family carbohydrate kinase [Deltaproteobacteria bacterium]|jgi:D-beta-D-heptose 7-phosphate kinase/D-beta-D-heptose 1-phosphate adenosyltransferase|nr:PfkB family carbohydrate kinase [Deltaproteobacteria bacterium]